jgi:hypothetical protein
MIPGFGSASTHRCGARPIGLRPPFTIGYSAVEADSDSIDKCLIVIDQRFPQYRKILSAIFLFPAIEFYLPWNRGARIMTVSALSPESY